MVYAFFIMKKYSVLDVFVFYCFEEAEVLKQASNRAKNMYKTLSVPKLLPTAVMLMYKAYNTIYKT